MEEKDDEDKDEIDAKHVHTQSGSEKEGER